MCHVCWAWFLCTRLADNLNNINPFLVRDFYLGTHHLISERGGGPRKKLKKIVCCHKSRKKKFVENVGRKKKFVVEIYEKYVDQKKTPNGNLHNKESIRQKISSAEHKKKLSDVDCQKKTVFSRRRKKKFASNKNSRPPPPPPRYLMVRPLAISFNLVI